MECRKCQNPMAPKGAAVEGTARETHVAIADYPYNECERCGSRALVEGMFQFYMSTAFMEAMPIAKKGTFSRKSSCMNCGSVLNAVAVSPQTVSASLLVRQRYPLHVEVKALGFVCPSCGTVQFEGDAQAFAKGLTDSLAAALRPLAPLHAWKAA